MSNILSTPNTQGNRSRRSFGSSHSKRRTRQASPKQQRQIVDQICREVEARKQAADEEIKRLTEEMPANAAGVNVLFTWHFSTETKQMSFDEYKELAHKSYTSFAGWILKEGVIGGKPSKERVFCDNTVEHIVSDDNEFDRMNEEPPYAEDSADNVNDMAHEVACFFTEVAGGALSNERRS